MANAGFDVMLSPPEFKAKDKDLEQVLMEFDLYIRRIKNFFIATNHDSTGDRAKIAVLQAIGGTDMVDLV